MRHGIKFPKGLFCEPKPVVALVARALRKTGTEQGLVEPDSSEGDQAHRNSDVIIVMVTRETGDAIRDAA